MQAVTATLRRETARHQIDWSGLMTALVGGITRAFGCWHREMSRPFTLRAESYRACLECGARRRFDTQTWEMTGPFYYESATAAELYQGSKAALKVTTAQRQQPRALRAA